MTFIIMGIDKWKARHHRWRIPERFLFICAFLYGAAGILTGMLVFHHKVRKPAFYIVIPLLLLSEIMLCLWLIHID